MYSVNPIFLHNTLQKVLTGMISFIITYIYIYIPRNHFPPRLSVMCQAMNIIMPYCSVASTRTKLFEVWTFLGDSVPKRFYFGEVWSCFSIE